jgi:hypothetical protein
MGFLDFLFDKEKAQERQIEKLRKKLTNLWVQSPDRNDAASQLFQIGTPTALHALMERFKVQTQNTTYDIEEKTFVYDILSGAGPAVADVVKENVRTEPAVINWQMRVLEDVLPSQDLAVFITELLSTMDVDYERDPVKKEQLILRAQTYTDYPDLQKEIARFTVSDNEDIRFQSVSAVIKRDEEWARDSLRANIRLEDSGRIKAMVCERLAKMNWTALDDLENEELAAEIREALPPKYHLTETGHVKRK